MLSVLPALKLYLCLCYIPFLYTLVTLTCNITVFIVERWNQLEYNKWLLTVKIHAGQNYLNSCLHRNQSPKRKYKIECRTTQTTQKCQCRIRCLEGVSILCWPVGQTEGARCVELHMPCSLSRNYVYMITRRKS
jgi:hypothetical protein